MEGRTTSVDHVRHLVGHGRLKQVISEQRHVKARSVDTDSDYAGCVLTRKSTTCVCLLHGDYLMGIDLDAWCPKFESCRVRVSRQLKGASILMGAKSMIFDCVEDVFAVCSRYGQQFSQEYHGNTWGKTKSLLRCPVRLFVSVECGN